MSSFHCLFPVDHGTPLDVHLLTFGGDTYNYNKNYTKLFIGDDDDDDDDGGGVGEVV